MENLESLLRDEFDAPAVRPRGSVTELIATTRRLRRRRTAGRMTAVVAAVLVLVMSVLLTQGVLAGRERTANPNPEPTVIDPTIDEAVFTKVITVSGIPWEGGFVDADRGYLMMAICPKFADEDCHARVLATIDGGATFTERTPPPMDRINVSTSSLWVFGPNALVFEAKATASFPLQRWASADAGLTWREVSAVPVGLVDHIPVGAKLVQSTGGATLVLTADGSAYTLSTKPAGAELKVSFSGLPTNYEGAHFLENAAGDLFVSTDRGASWQLADTRGHKGVRPIGGLGDRVYGVLASIGDRTYGRALTPPDLYVSDDRGRTWNTVRWPQLTIMAGPVDETKYGVDTARASLAVLPDGGLLLADRLRMWRLMPGGDAFEPVGDLQTHLVGSFDGFVMGLRGGVNDAAYYSTVDGEDWRPLDLG
jgi:hypothetical protein